MCRGGVGFRGRWAVIPVTPASILVGVDGSEQSTRAVRWAAEEAARRGRPVRLLHSYGLPSLGYDEGLFSADWMDPLRLQSAELLAAAREAALDEYPQLDLTVESVVDSQITVLIEYSRWAGMIVLGASGAGGFAGRLTGSTAVAVAAHARCPVAVIRNRPDGTTAWAGPVVVGIDGSPVSEAATAFAFEEAAVRGAPLVAVHAWSDADYEQLFSEARFAADFEPLRNTEERLLAERLAGWSEKYPEVQVERVLMLDRPRAALIERSTKAQLIVVGSRGRGGFRGLLLGSTSQALLHHAGCPVVVVRPTGGRH
ncbi:universal stress protein [Amycolatopsis aidingensis]|uniref:universal stress protein n=1 Tax=Amycolatopsis aidingensis TaxID=2842453 RepID=UPI001C0CA077|nr:universal stress protein [Amycolatopsis aidingensis]